MTELDRRLNELCSRYWDEHDLNIRTASARELVLAAARIGAEIEREECARLVWSDCDDGAERKGLADAIRARGGASQTARGAK
jgi:hypothetical protein